VSHPEAFKPTHPAPSCLPGSPILSPRTSLYSAWIPLCIGCSPIRPRRDRYSYAPSSCRGLLTVTRRISAHGTRCIWRCQEASRPARGPRRFPDRGRVSASAVMASTTNGRNAWALRFMCALRAAQIGASHFLPIFYRPAETGYERTPRKIGKVMIYAAFVLLRSCSLTSKPACHAGTCSRCVIARATWCFTSAHVIRSSAAISL
jgi:hypothetical protein